MDAMTVEPLRDLFNPTRLQLLGLSGGSHTIDGAKGRSGRYYPSDREVLTGTTAFGRIARRIRSLPKQVMRRLRS